MPGSAVASRGMLQIASNRDGAVLSINRADRLDYYRADVRYGPMGATVEFYEISMRPLRDFFAALAEAWRGWDTEQRWGSLEGELNLRATHDQLGTVTLVSELRSGVYMDAGATWTASAVLYLDAGHLDQHARSAARLAE